MSNSGELNKSLELEDLAHVFEQQICDVDLELITDPFCGKLWREVSEVSDDGSREKKSQ